MSYFHSWACRRKLFLMPAWLVWALVAVALAVGEIFTPGLFFLGPVALAAVAAAIAAARVRVPLGLELQPETCRRVAVAGAAEERPGLRQREVDVEEDGFQLSHSTTSACSG